jgi:uncharacterized membrane protein
MCLYGLSHLRSSDQRRGLYVERKLTAVPISTIRLTSVRRTRLTSGIQGKNRDHGREKHGCLGTLPYTFPTQSDLNPVDGTKFRLVYIDWMRGLACVLMFQTHGYDSWLGGAARQSRFFMYSQLGGTFPAPLFLFLAGISFALVIEKLRRKSLSPGQIAASAIRRGARIFGFGLLFRLQEYVISWGWAPTSDLFRVDILNTIGLSMMMMGVFCWAVLALPRAGAITPDAIKTGRRSLALSAAGTALSIALVTPLLWTTWSPNWLPWPVASYINGVHNLGTPQAWLFPIFPWSGFAFAGLAVGLVLESDWARARETKVLLSVSLVGLALIQVSRWFDALPRHLYPVYDYWHTSPQFFLTRVGMLLVMLTLSYAWCRWGTAPRGFSPIIQLGQASLVVYWVHIELVYGRVSILPKRSEGIAGASAGLLTMCVAMVLLAYIRTHFEGWMKTARANAPLKASS